MKKSIYVLVIVVSTISALFILLAFRHPVRNAPMPITNSPLAIQSNADANFQTSSPLQHLQFSKLKCDLKDFTDFEKNEFVTNFTARYKPALKKWCDAFSGRIPFSPEAVTISNFVERIGTRPTYREYIFVVDGITLGIQDAKGVARVDYLNAPKETGKLTILPNGGEPPIATTPVSKEELVKILAAEGGTQYKPNEIRLIPSGYSGALNGGAFANVGGDPNNAASWKHDMVFGPDGKLVYYLRGHE